MIASLVMEAIGYAFDISAGVWLVWRLPNGHISPSLRLEPRANISLAKKGKDIRHKPHNHLPICMVRPILQRHPIWHLRQSNKKRRKRYRSRDSRGVLPNKSHISERPISAENKSRIGHFEIDTVHGSKDQHSIVTIVDRKSKFTIIGKLKSRTKEELNRKVIQLIQKQVNQVKTITADNGTEFHGYKEIEKATNAKFYFANPYHSWERGLNENTNGLIRQYLAKGKSMKHITQKDCDEITLKLNRRPRKILNLQTPEEVYVR